MSEQDNALVIDAVTETQTAFAAMAQALREDRDRYVEGSHAEGDEQRQVRNEVAADFPRFVESALQQDSSEIRKARGVVVRHHVDETGNEEIELSCHAYPQEMLFLVKSVDPAGGTTQYSVTDVAVRYRHRFLHARQLKATVHDNDPVALKRARILLNVSPVRGETVPPASMPTPSSAS